MRDGSGPCLGRDDDALPLDFPLDTCPVVGRLLLSACGSLADPSETLVYTFDLGTILPYMPINKDVEALLPPLTEEETRVWADYELESYRLLRQAAEARGIKVIDLVPALQPDGPYTVPPEEKYFLMLGFSAEGEAVIADLLRQAGYDYDRP